MTRLNYIIYLVYLSICQQNNLYVVAESYCSDCKDLPQASDLENYLKIISRVSQYCSKHKNNIDVQLAFGIFVTVVNIKYALIVKKNSIRATIRTRMENIITKNEEFLQYFSTYNIDYKNKNILQITYLFTNPADWMMRLQNFTYTHRKKTSLNELEKTYTPWDQYLYFVSKIDEWRPSPNQSDACLAALSANPVNKKPSYSLCPLSMVCQYTWETQVPNLSYITWCPLLKSCYSMLKSGSNFGYALTHRILLLVMARYGRGCSVFSEKNDEDLSKHLCAMAYGEAQYISLNNYGHADLMLEIILLCSFEGHSEFLRRSWLMNLRKFQQGGCFSIEASSSRSSRKLSITRKEKGSKLHKVCNKHMTALATGTYSIAVRYIIQEYY